MQTTMALPCLAIRTSLSFLRRHRLLQLFLLHAILSLPSLVLSQDDREILFQGLNSYRESLNLPPLLENSNGDCFAEELANQLKDRPCPSFPGWDTFPGMAPQFSNYRELLRNCHLNVTTTRDGAVMPVCVPDSVPSMVLRNYTDSFYTHYLNDDAYVGAGIGSEGDWTVVVLTKNTIGGSFASNSVSLLGFNEKLLPWISGSFLLLLT